MKIGILIPTFNRKQQLAQAIDSVLLQTHQDIELIIIDDSSSDGTKELVAGYSDPRIRYVYNVHNAGLIENINKGIPMFSDEVHWCMILCDDDLLEKDCLNKLAIALNTAGAKSVIHVHRIFIDNQGGKIKDAILSPPEETALDYIRMRSRSQRETYLTGVLFNRTVFQEINGYPDFFSGLAADDAFIFALALKDRLVFERSAAVFIRIHPGAESIICHDSINKLRAVQQFNDYCIRMAKTNSMFSPAQFALLHASLKMYIQSLSSFWWLKGLECALQHPDDRKHEQFVALLGMFNEYRDNYTFRIKFAVACEKLTGYLPEASAWYRICWAGFIKMTQYMSKMLTC